jgi:hypothetical protein
MQTERTSDLAVGAPAFTQLKHGLAAQAQQLFLELSQTSDQLADLHRAFKRIVNSLDALNLRFPVLHAGEPSHHTTVAAPCRNARSELDCVAAPL